MTITISVKIGFKSFRSEKITLAGIEVVRILKKKQLIHDEFFSSSFEQFCCLAQ